MSINNKGGVISVNILIYDLNGSLLTYDIEYFFRKMGHSCKNILRPVYDKYADEEFVLEMEKELSGTHYDLIFTTNYYPVVARVCYEQKIPYYSWTYDSPPEIYSTETMEYPTNHIFFFSKYDYQKFSGLGLDNVHYLPLAVNTERLSKISKRDDYASDVALVGGLYKSEFLEYREIMSAEQQQYIDAVIQVQLMHSGSTVVDAALNDEFIEGVCAHYRSLSNVAVQPNKDVLFYSLCAHLTHLDRVTILSLSGKRGFDTRLYYGKARPADREILEKNSVKIHGFVRYMDEMPAVFKSTKISINSTLRANRTGIPLRVVDVLGTGGFLLTNLQSEMLDFFKEDELATYETSEDAIEKISFYLKNDDVREKIAVKGYERVLRDFSYEDRLSRMLEN